MFCLEYLCQNTIICKDILNVYRLAYLSWGCGCWELGRVEFVVQFLMVLLGIDEEELVRGVGQLTEHSVDSNSNQNMHHSAVMPVNAFRQFTIFLFLAVHIKATFKNVYKHSVA